MFLQLIFCFRALTDVQSNVTLFESLVLIFLNFEVSTKICWKGVWQWSGRVGGGGGGSKVSPIVTHHQEMPWFASFPKKSTLFHRVYVPAYLCSNVSMFHHIYVPQCLCSTVSSLCSIVWLFYRFYVLPFCIFTTSTFHSVYDPPYQCWTISIFHNFN